ncbi:FIST C-terminal domain-containing protein [Comamonadaceae bacterium G21597-S1]|nr:FIST C-terminal domain-containing protein [Comamonadaceae bacterium G21597-S1]
MHLFPHGHATHPDWTMAAGLVLAQLRAQMALPEYAKSPTLALLYITDHYAASANDILDHLSAELPGVTDWSGTVGIGVSSNNVEYFDEPAMAVMLCDLPVDQYRVFSGVAPLGAGFDAATALVHVDPATPDVSELVQEMAARTTSGYLFGGLSASRTRTVQFAAAGDGNIRGHGAAGGVFSGGLSGVAFGPGVPLVSRVTQGCRPVSGFRTVTEADQNLVVAIGGEPALDVLMGELGVSLDRPQEALDAIRATLVGLVRPSEGDGAQAMGRGGNFGSDVIVRHIIGLDPARRGIAISDQANSGMQLAFCQRNREAARSDLIRICAEIREELEPLELTMETATALAASEAEAAAHPARGIAGAVYVSCSGRGGPHFGGPSAELQIVRRALGDVPLVGFFAGGEIARHHLYGYTGVLTVFAQRD